MRLLLLYFGSANLADGANMFHVTPESVEAGDLLLHRWQRRGIGHVMPIFRVNRQAEDALEVTIASGSMPRREPVWEDPNSARSSFTNSYAGSSEIAEGDTTLRRARRRRPPLAHRPPGERAVAERGRGSRP